MSIFQKSLSIESKERNEQNDMDRNYYNENNYRGGRLWKKLEEIGIISPEIRIIKIAGAENIFMDKFFHIIHIRFLKMRKIRLD
jgi:hypothetical protein